MLQILTLLVKLLTFLPSIEKILIALHLVLEDIKTMDKGEACIPVVPKSDAQSLRHIGLTPTPEKILQTKQSVQLTNKPIIPLASETPPVNSQLQTDIENLKKLAQDGDL